ncbi:hypothetical protein OH76DRAFT_439011 [Lentinus brumalis]|uniref:Uncharacterized protein n=1 Tax=Lentinus brumalis TaxID=2498619 RepID=A0A371DDV1_9APHY|nr:hypothetical protein OH76DRAFT_439011 [Polyporus brumalis]
MMFRLGRDSTFVASSIPHVLQGPSSNPWSLRFPVRSSRSKSTTSHPRRTRCHGFDVLVQSCSCTAEDRFRHQRLRGCGIEHPGNVRPSLGIDIEHSPVAVSIRPPEQCHWPASRYLPRIISLPDIRDEVQHTMSRFCHHRTCSSSPVSFHVGFPRSWSCTDERSLRCDMNILGSCQTMKSFGCSR